MHSLNKIAEVTDRSETRRRYEGKVLSKKIRDMKWRDDCLARRLKKMSHLRIMESLKDMSSRGWKSSKLDALQQNRWGCRERISMHKYITPLFLCLWHKPLKRLHLLCNTSKTWDWLQGKNWIETISRERERERDSIPDPIEWYSTRHQSEGFWVKRSRSWKLMSLLTQPLLSHIIRQQSFRSPSLKVITEKTRSRREINRIYAHICGQRIEFLSGCRINGPLVRLQRLQDYYWVSLNTVHTSWSFSSSSVVGCRVRRPQRKRNFKARLFVMIQVMYLVRRSAAGIFRFTERTRGTDRHKLSAPSLKEKYDYHLHTFFSKWGQFSKKVDDRIFDERRRCFSSNREFLRTEKVIFHEQRLECLLGSQFLSVLQAMIPIERQGDFFLSNKKKYVETIWQREWFDYSSQMRCQETTECSLARHVFKKSCCKLLLHTNSESMTPSDERGHISCLTCFRLQK